MSTRATIIVMEGNTELVRIYHHSDGYPEGLGVKLAKLCNVEIVNGLTIGQGAVANGMGCLAAQIVAGLKSGPGGVYIEPVGGEVNDDCEYVYIVRGDVGRPVTIECSTQTGPFPFNLQDKAAHVFTLRPAAVVKKYHQAA